MRRLARVLLLAENMHPTATSLSAESTTPAQATRSAPAGSRVLVAEDDDLLLRAYARALGAVGFKVDLAENGQKAVDLLLANSYDAVVSDITLPCVDGVGVLQAAQKCDPDMPVVLITGAPRLDTAIAAVEHSAFRYLLKPLSMVQLQDTVIYSVQMHRISVLRRMAIDLASAAWSPAEDRSSLGELFDCALQSIWMAYQPIFSWKGKRIFAHEALLRTSEPTMATPGVFLSAAERLNRMAELGRMVRDRVAAEVPNSPARFLFVNLHSSDLLDEHLFDPGSALSKVADRVVLEVTERASLASVPEVGARVDRLRKLGFRIALDDMGAGYAGLTSFTTLQPTFVKYDMSLVRGIGSSPTQCKIISAMTSLFAEMGVNVIAEGVETESERDFLLELGVDLMQGYLFGRPAPMCDEVTPREGGHAIVPQSRDNGMTPPLPVEFGVQRKRHRRKLPPSLQGATDGGAQRPDIGGQPAVSDQTGEEADHSLSHGVRALESMIPGAAT
jgi:EAL domain-containing protein (putative c-di-GMP-specific phosphodiesterase class I)/ActR/RegA family two-component response regulator